MSMAKAQSDFFRNLTNEEQEKYLLVIQENGAYNLPERCSLDVLKECNENQTAIKECFDTSVAYSSIPTCLNPRCPGCGAALAHLLGFDVNAMATTRFITYNTSSVLGNILSTPYAITEDPAFKTHMYIDGNGMLKHHEGMTQRLERHRTYWEAKLGPIKRERDANAQAVSTIIDAASQLLDVIDKTKAMYLDDLKKSIDKINVNVEGITAEAKKNIEEARTLLYTSEVKVQKTRAVLENLAEETITRVDTMLYFLSKVDDDWEVDKIAKYLSFEAKKMSWLVDRSLTLIKAANDLYDETRVDLAGVLAKLESFNTFMKTLGDSSSAAYKERVKKIRAIVYGTCCTVGAVYCPACCLVCAVTTESEISKWKSSVTSLQTTINVNKAGTTKLINDAEATQDKLGKEVTVLLKWQSNLVAMSQVDWKFEEAELFGFPDVRSELAKSLDNLKNGAKKYLAINSQKNLKL